MRLLIVIARIAFPIGITLLLSCRGLGFDRYIYWLCLLSFIPFLWAFFRKIDDKDKDPALVSMFREWLDSNDD